MAMNKFYPSAIKNEIYEIMENHYSDEFNEIFSQEFISILITFFEQKDIEVNYEVEECGNLIDKCVFFAWIENGHLQSMSFYVEA